MVTAELWASKFETNAVGAGMYLFDSDWTASPPPAAVDQRDQLALGEVVDRFLDVMQRVFEPAHGSTVAVGAGLPQRAAELGEQFWQRPGMNTGPQQPRQRFAVMADHDRPERSRAIGRVEPPVLLELPDQEPEHSRDLADDDGGQRHRHTHPQPKRRGEYLLGKGRHER